MEYFENKEYELQKNKLLELLSDFYYATKTPIWLYTHAAALLLSIPKETSPESNMQNLFPIVSSMEHTYECVHDYNFCIVSPIIATQGLFGYLCVELSENANSNTISGIKRFLELVRDEIIRENLVVLQYQRYVDQFKMTIWDMLDRDLNISSLCEIMGVGKTKLSSDFKRYAGTSIARFILNARIEKARGLLATTSLSVTEISERVGFHDYNYFCRVFRKYNGVSPRTYRLKHVL